MKIFKKIEEMYAEAQLFNNKYIQAEYSYWEKPTPKGSRPVKLIHGALVQKWPYRTTWSPFKTKWIERVYRVTEVIRKSVGHLLCRHSSKREIVVKARNSLGIMKETRVSLCLHCYKCITVDKCTIKESTVDKMKSVHIPLGYTGDVYFPNVDFTQVKKGDVL